MNDWASIEAALNADESITKGRRNEIWRWTKLARDWLDREGLDIRSVADGDIERFIADVPPISGATKDTQRRSALRGLRKAAITVEPAIARRPGTAAARVDDVPARSPLGKAIRRVLARGRTQDRAVWATCLGTFLRWCDRRGVDPADCWPGDLDVYRRDLVADGYRSPGEYRRVAKLLLETLAEALGDAGA